jgi:dTDP-glucose pyrophosphorylase/predicted transcriptional regulator
MRNIRDIFVSRDTLILAAMQHLDKGAAQIVLVVDEADRLLGAVTDGDVRRAVLRGVGLDQPVSKAMNGAPVTAHAKIAQEVAVALMRERAVHQLPLIDDDGRVVGLITYDEALHAMRQDTLVVLIAGGLGSRLRPLTNDTPKPLLSIGGKPLLEITISNLARQGFGRFSIAVNYKADMFRAHFGEGKSLGVEINYLHENETLGTAGALRLLPERPTAPLLVMNGDVLTNLDARQLLLFHREQNVAATMCVRDYEWRIPYGVVRIDGGRLAEFEEKPARHEFVNAGIYALSPEALDHIPPEGPLDMPELFRRIAQSVGPAAVYPLREYWIDIGQLDDLQRAQSDAHIFQ